MTDWRPKTVLDYAPDAMVDQGLHSSRTVHLPSLGDFQTCNAGVSAHAREKLGHV